MRFAMMTGQVGRPNCHDKAAQAQYPSNGITDSDLSNAAKCFHGKSDDPADYVGDDTQKDWYQVGGGGSCNWTLQVPIYSSYAEDCGSGCVTVHGYVSGYETLEVGGDCSGPPPV